MPNLVMNLKILTMKKIQATVLGLLLITAVGCKQAKKDANEATSGVEEMVDEMVEEVSGKSIMGVLMLAAECGSDLVIRAHGEDSAEAVDALSSLIESRFGEE